MPDQEQLEQQWQRLYAHRKRLAALLDQQAQFGRAYAPTHIITEIPQVRDSIRHIKTTLRGWGVDVEDLPDDEGYIPPRRTRIFISYKRDVAPDEPVALEVYEALRRQHEVFIDQTTLVGTAWAERITAELRRADFLITFLSAHAVNSEMVKGEVVASKTLSMTPRGAPTAGADGTARIYVANFEDLLALARTRVTRQLTCEERRIYLQEDVVCPTATPAPATPTP